MKRTALVLAAAALLIATGCSSEPDAPAADSSVSVSTATRVTPTTIAPTVRTPADTAFLELIGGEVALSDPAALKIGHEVCDRMDAGDSLNEATIAVQEDGAVVRKTAVLVAMSAPPTLCPQHLASARQDILDGAVTGAE